jgi:hypothetical protein
VAVREPVLDADDLAVVAALFDDIFRPNGRAALRTRALTPRFLVVGTTMTMCRPDPAALGPPPGRCLNSTNADMVSAVVPPEMVPTVRLRFPMWNATPLWMAGSLGEDVTVASATLLDMVAPGGLLRGGQPDTAIFSFSAPGFLAPHMAVVTYESTSATGAARVERRPDGRWRVVAQVSRPVD